MPKTINQILAIFIFAKTFITCCVMTVMFLQKRIIPKLMYILSALLLAASAWLILFDFIRYRKRMRILNGGDYYDCNIFDDECFSE